MTTQDNPRYAAALARAVDQLRRSAEPGEPQKAALRALVALAAERSATVRFYDNELTVDGEVIATADPRLAAFAELLGAQSIQEIVIARGAEATELLALTSGLAARPGLGRIKEKLRDAGSTRVMLVIQQPIDPTQKRVTVSGAFEKERENQASMAEWNRFLNHGAKSDTEVDLGLKEHATGEIQIHLDAKPGQPPVTTPRHVDPPGYAPEPTPSLPQPATLQAASPLGIGLARLLADPYGRDALTKLTQLSRNIEDAFTRGSVAEAIDSVNTLVELEGKAPDAGVKNTYGVILGRILTRAALAKAAPYLLEVRRRGRASVTLKRGGEASTGLLVALITEAPTLGERLRYVEVLRQIPDGTDQLLALLSSRSEWQTARNIAEVAGEARIESAVGYLARLQDHADDRVRRAALVALAKIGTVATVEPLRTALKSGPPELRALVAASINGPLARPLTAPLASLADEEENPDVARALIKAIGRIGTPEAKQALERAASQKTLFSRRGKVVREAAEEALKAFVAGPS